MLRYLLAALLITAMPASAESFDCRVIGIADGNTFSCQTNMGDRLRVRLAEIDTPALKQPYGIQARQALSSHIIGKNVTLKVKRRDDLGRTLAQVSVGNIDVNSELVRVGAAWAHRGHLDDRRLLDLEAVAREFRRGLWSLHQTEQPPAWESREQTRKNRRPASP
ncbi:thermonuclease family protein [Stutzerimonas chloritidismutans]|uniref:Thermonuclease family protein n=1 Tax=Stutzerimonas chloritidismutans TaxID=203192 RepID=A0ABU9M2F3_STUCH